MIEGLKLDVYFTLLIFPLLNEVLCDAEKQG